MRRYTIGEVCDLLDTRAHTLRYWEQEVPVVRPMKDESGRRTYRESDVQQLFRLKYLVTRRGMTLRGAGQRLVEDAQPGVADRKATVRQLRSNLLRLADRARRLRSKVAQAIEAPYTIRDRSDSPSVLRRWKELSYQSRTRFLEELSDFPDYWVEHIRRLSGPGRPFTTAAGTLKQSDRAARYAKARRDDPGLVSEGAAAFRTRSLALLWWPAEDYPAPSDLPFDIDGGLVFVAPPVGRFEAWERSSGRWASAAGVRLSRRFPVPVFDTAGDLSVRDSGHIERSDSRLTGAVAWLTQPHRRARFMSEGISSLGIVLPGSGLEINPADAARHRRAHASLTARLTSSEGRVRVRGPIWLDLGFLAGLTRARNEAAEELGEQRICPHMSLGKLVDYAALPQLFHD